MVSGGRIVLVDLKDDQLLSIDLWLQMLNNQLGLTAAIKIVDDQIVDGTNLV